MKTRCFEPSNFICLCFFILIWLFVSSNCYIVKSVQEKMADVGFLSVLVKSLTRDDDERREAVGLLSSLSDIAAVRRRIGRIQGCIVMLVSIFNGEDEVASGDAGSLLNSLSSNSQYVLNMAEAGYFKPLVHYLKQGL